MMRNRMRRLLKQGLCGACAAVLLLPAAWAQGRKSPAESPAPPAAVVTVEQPDAERTKEQLNTLLEHYPPSLRNVLALDPSLLGNQSYLSPYPALVAFLTTHPEVARNPAFYLGEGPHPPIPADRASQILDMWRDVMAGVAVFTGLAMAIGLVVWLIRTLVDYRRWNRLTKVQTDVHTKILDRFTANNELLAYIQSPAGANFLQSAPIKLDAAPRSVGAPLSRILWSVQGGVVLIAGGIGLNFVSARLSEEAAQPLQALGVLGLALGLGFVISAIISFVISRRLGLIESRADAPGIPGTGLPE